MPNVLSICLFTERSQVQCSVDAVVASLSNKFHLHYSSLLSCNGNLALGGDKIKDQQPPWVRLTMYLHLHSVLIVGAGKLKMKVKVAKNCLCMALP